MANIEDAPRLRELCERASMEYDHDKLLDLLRQINDLLERERPSDAEKEELQPSAVEAKKASPRLWGVVAVSMIAKTAEEWLELYRWNPPPNAEREPRAQGRGENFAYAAKHFSSIACNYKAPRRAAAESFLIFHSKMADWRGGQEKR